MSTSTATAARTRLAALGWGEREEALFGEHAAAGQVPGRVLVEHRGQYTVDTGEGETQAAVSGRMRHEATRAEDFPAVGDWVAVSRPGAADGVIHAVLPRRSRFARPARGDIPGAQVVAANIDVVLVVSALDHDFNLRRIERYMALAWASGADPVIVLNKSDACDDLLGRLLAVESVAPGVRVLAVSARDGSGLDAVGALLAPGLTFALLGSSGVGKSTLVNALLGWERQLTADVRADDQRGRHTTTLRELLPMPGGALLIDNPGMRAVGMWEAEDGLGAAFAEIEAAAADCRFSDCSHATEPGCAVQTGIREGSLSAHRLESRRKMERELAALERRKTPAARAEARRRGRMIGKAVRSHMRTKYGHG
jgi:ribosome biogenesis GTPase / thiamine phosphate phosphatase